MSDGFAFAESTGPAKSIVLRIPLMPYSLGHELILLRELNPVILKGWEFLPEQEKRKSVIRAVSVCSRTWKENQKPDRWLRFWIRLIHNEDFEQAKKQFDIYRNQGSTCPEVLSPEIEPDDEPPREIGSCYQSRLTAYAASIFNESCFDQPLGMLQHLYFTFLESKGVVRIPNEFEKTIISEEAEIREQYKKEKEEEARKKCQP